MQRFAITLALFVAAAALSTAAAPRHAVAQDDPEVFAVVINPANDYSGAREEMIGMIKQLYLKERNGWPKGIESKPFGRAEDSPEHKAFLTGVLKMTQAELAQHWISVKQKTGQTPPRAVPSDRMLAKLVNKYDGAFAVLTAKAAEELGADVKVLFRFD